MLKLEQLRKLQEELHDSLNGSNPDDDVIVAEENFAKIMECLEWCEAQLEQRRTNTKAYLTKQKIRNKLLREHLSPDEMRQIDEQARRAAEGK
jgi:hypothetical protein